VSFLTAPEWTSSCQSSGFAGILPFATHPPALAVSGKRVAQRRLGGVYSLLIHYQQHLFLRYPFPVFAVSGKRIALCVLAAYCFRFINNFEAVRTIC
jgi:hypothetical protein